MTQTVVAVLEKPLDVTEIETEFPKVCEVRDAITGNPCGDLAVWEVLLQCDRMHTNSLYMCDPCFQDILIDSCACNQCMSELVLTEKKIIASVPLT